MNRTDALTALSIQLATTQAELERAETVYCTLLASRNGPPDDGVLASIQTAIAHVEAAVNEVEELLADTQSNRPISPAFDADLRAILMQAGRGWSFTNMPWPEFVAGLEVRSCPARTTCSHQ